MVIDSKKKREDAEGLGASPCASARQKMCATTSHMTLPIAVQRKVLMKNCEVTLLPHVNCYVLEYVSLATEDASYWHSEDRLSSAKQLESFEVSDG